jgi:hypothetical protein
MQAAPRRIATRSRTKSSRIGPLRRPLDSGYRGADYDFITAETERASMARPRSNAAGHQARPQRVRAQRTQGQLLRDLVANASTRSTTTGRSGGRCSSC